MSDIPFLRRASIVLSFAVGALPLGCGDQAEQEPSYTLVSAHPTDVSIAGLSSELQAQFGEGDANFEELRRETQGLGPVFIRRSCGSCHREGLRGPGRVEKMVALDAESGEPAPDQSSLPFGPTVRPYVTAGAMAPVEAPSDDPSLQWLAHAGLADVARSRKDRATTVREFEATLRTIERTRASWRGRACSTSRSTRPTTGRTTASTTWC